MYKIDQLTVYSGITGSLSGSATTSVSASYAPTLLPEGVVSSSTQIETWAVATASVATTASYAVVAETLLGSVESASYAQTAATASYFSGSAIFDNGITGSFSGSYRGTLTITDGAAASSSAGATYTTAEQTLLNQIRQTLISRGFLT